MEKIPEQKIEALINSSDIAINPESNLAVVVIKPDAFKNKDQIIKKLENSGLYVVKSVTKRLPDNFVIGEMYQDLPTDIEAETLKHFNLGPSEIVLLKGDENLVGSVVEVTGLNTDPNQCDEQSIRYLFGEHFGRDTEECKTYFRNAVHRAKDSKEQKADLDKFEDFL
jgi:nucleoside diphosphate kinase